MYFWPFRPSVCKKRGVRICDQRDCGNNRNFKIKSWFFNLIRWKGYRVLAEEKRKGYGETRQGFWENNRIATGNKEQTEEIIL